MNQDHFKIGPLIYAKDYFEDDPKANYYWSGIPPVEYNDNGVPVDKNGTDCLDLKCPFHPSWSPKKDQIEFNSFLEFSIPNNQLIKTLYNLYSSNVIPYLGKIICNDVNSYRYLVESIKIHPDQANILKLMKSIGFKNCYFSNLTYGIAAMHIGVKT